MSRPSGSVEAGRWGICTVGSSTDMRTSRQEPCSRRSEQDCPQSPSMESGGGLSTEAGARSLLMLRPRDGSKSIPVPMIAKERARFHGVEFKIIRCWKSFKTLSPCPRVRPADSMALDSVGTRPRRPRARVKLRAPALHGRVGVYGAVRILDDDMAAEGLVGRLRRHGFK